MIPAGKLLNTHSVIIISGLILAVLIIGAALITVAIKGRVVLVTAIEIASSNC